MGDLLRSPSAKKYLDTMNEDACASVTNIEGDEKTGKNHLACTAPDPIVVLSGDRDMRDVVRKFPRKRIEVLRFRTDVDPRWDEQTVQNTLLPVWRDFTELFWDTMSSKSVRTMVVDTGSWLWRFIQLVYFGKTSKVFPIAREKVNAIMERMLLRGEDSGKNVIWLHRLRDEWIDVPSVNKQGKKVLEPRRTGNKERVGFKSVGFDVQVNIRVFRDPPIAGKFCARVISNSMDPQWDGHVFKGRMVDFPTIMASLKGNDPGDWK